MSGFHVPDSDSPPALVSSESVFHQAPPFAARDVALGDIVTERLRDLDCGFVDASLKGDEPLQLPQRSASVDSCSQPVLRTLSADAKQRAKHNIAEEAHCATPLRNSLVQGLDGDLDTAQKEDSGYVNDGMNKWIEEIAVQHAPSANGGGSESSSLIKENGDLMEDETLEDQIEMELTVKQTELPNIGNTTLPSVAFARQEDILPTSAAKLQKTKSRLAAFGMQSQARTGILLSSDPERRYRRKKKKVRFQLYSMKRARFFEGPLMQEKVLPYAKDTIFTVKKILLLYEMWALPYRPALAESNITEALFFIDIFVDTLHMLYLIGDVCHRVVGAYLDSYGNEGYHYELPHEVAAKQKGFRNSSRLKQACIVAWHVVKTHSKDILCELLVIWPMYITMVWSHSLWQVWIAMLPRIQRPVALWSYVRQQEMAIHVNVRKLAVLKFSMLLFGAVHWVGCGFYWLARVGDFDTSEHFGTMVGQYMDVADTAFNAESSRQLPFAYLYIIFRGLSTLSSTGYEQAVPKRMPEMAASILVLFIALVMEAYVIGTLFHYLVKKDPDVEAFQKRLQRLEDYAAIRQLPRELTDRLEHYLKFQYSKRSSSGKIIKSLPHSLQMKVCLYQYGEAINRNRFIFRDCNEQFLALLTLNMNEVYLMPSEVHVRQGDMSRSISFVTQGSLQCSKDGNVLRTVRADSDDATIVGEVAFFMGIPEPYTYAARESSDCTVLVFTKEVYEELMGNFPEQHGILVSHLLAGYGLNNIGGDEQTAAAVSEMSEEQEEEFLALKETIKMALVRRNADALTAMTYAASEGDVDTVRDFLLRGLPINSGDYDARTTLHLACAEGNLRVVELLVSEGADVNPSDRWGNTPLYDAITNKHGLIVDYLQSHGGQLITSNAPAMLCNAASIGDVDAMAVLIQNGVDQDSHDYDGRTALHLAASTGHLTVSKFLIDNGANPNAKDRWGSTPLQDAVLAGQPLVAELIHKAGGTLNIEDEAGFICSAAAEGAVSRMLLLAKCGLDINASDYDQRSALHLACAEKQILSVYILLTMPSIKVNAVDRWMGTPMEDALSSGAHGLGGAMLVQAAGGHVGPKASEHITGMPEKLEELTKLQGDPSKMLQLRRKIDILGQKVEAKIVYADMLDEDVVFRFHHDVTCYVLSHLPTIQSSINKVPDYLLKLEIAMEKLVSLLDKIMGVKAGKATKSKASTAHNPSKEPKGPVTTQDPYQILSKLNKIMLQLSRAEEPMTRFHNLLCNVAEGDAVSLDEQLRRVVAALGVAMPQSKTRTRIVQEIRARATIDSELSRLPLLGTLSSQHFVVHVLRGTKMTQPQIPADKNSTTTHEPANGNSVLGKAVLQSLDLIREAFNLMDLDGSGVLEAWEAYELWTLLRKKCGSDIALLLGCDQLGEGDLPDSIDYQQFMARCLKIMSEDLKQAVEEEQEVEDDNSSNGGGTDAISNCRDEDDATADEGYADLDKELQELDDAETLAQKMKEKKMQREGEGPSDGTIDESTGGQRLTSVEHSANNQKQSSRTRIASFDTAFSEGGKPAEDYTGAVARHFRDVPDGVSFTDLFNIEKIREFSHKALLFDWLTGSSKHRKAHFKAQQEKEAIQLMQQEVFVKAEIDGSGKASVHELTQIIQDLAPCAGKPGMLKSAESHVGKHITFADFSAHCNRSSRARDLFTAVCGINWHHSKYDLPLGASWLVLSPLSTVRQAWDNIIYLCIIFYFIEVPVRIAFDTLRRSGWWYFAIAQSFDAMLVADVAVKFCTAYKNKKSVMVVDIKRIRRHYFGTDFPKDFVCAFPMDLLIMLATYVLLQFTPPPALEDSSGEWIPHTLMAWLRLPKLGTLRRLINTGAATKRPTITVMGRLKTLMPMLLSLIHVLGCLWWYLGTKFDTVMGNHWVDYYAGFGSENISDEGSILEQYALSIYWISASLSTSGLIGGMQPKNFVEMLFSCFVMAIQLTFFKYVLGEISNVVMEQDAELVETRRAVHQMQHFIDQRELPEELTREITNFFEFMSSTVGSKVATDEKEEDIFELLSHSLQVEVAHHISRKLLDTIQIFQSCSSHFLDSLSVSLREVTWLPETYIYRVNDVSREMYIINKGNVELTSTHGEEEPETVDAVVSAGQVFGEVSFLFGLRQTMNARTGVGSTATVFALHKSDFSQMIKLFPDEGELINKAVLATWEEQYIEGRTSKSGDGASSVGGSEMSMGSLIDDSALDDMHTVKKVLDIAKDKKKKEKIVSLVDAASKNDMDEVDRILSPGDISVDSGDYDQRTGERSTWRAGRGHTSMVTRLLTHYGADINVEDHLGGTPATDALRLKQTEVLQILRDHGAKIQLEDASGEMCRAAAEGDLQQLQRLMENGIDPNLVDYDGRSALHLAASNGHSDCVDFLCSLPNIEVNQQDRKFGTPLADAVRHKHTPVQRLLVAHGAVLGDHDVATQLSSIEGSAAESARCCRALMLDGEVPCRLSFAAAAARNDIQLLDTFHKCGVDLNQSDYDDRTAMHLAASNGCLEVMSWMLKVESIDVNPVDRLGGTPLEDAYRHEQSIIVMMLERQGGLRAGHPILKHKMETGKARRAEQVVERSRMRVKEVASQSDDLALSKLCHEWVTQLHEMIYPILEKTCEMLSIMGLLLDVHMKEDQLWGAMQMTQYKMLMTVGNDVVRLWKPLVHKAKKQKDVKIALFEIDRVYAHKLVRRQCPQLRELDKKREEVVNKLYHRLHQIVKTAGKNDCYFDAFFKKRHGLQYLDSRWCSGRISKVTRTVLATSPDLDELSVTTPQANKIKEDRSEASAQL
ncbi:hypothetical protein CYMTET_6939 [Cymbomonas tetramitiformis]|uniref:Uncharacterized protein n=1 Tax=Cymbomonas tetramitiformis TaxID=36881 RepID=A0AAE0GW81_9CHLO|nr:hypothetical protein CYMTET_6939 [Cymbomonas tetramitiformis]